MPTNIDESEAGWPTLRSGDGGCLLALLASVSFIFAVVWGSGQWNPVGNRYMMIGTLAGLGAFATVGRRTSPALPFILGVGALFAAFLQFSVLSSAPPALYAPEAAPDEWLTYSRWILFAALLLVLLGFFTNDRLLVHYRRLLLALGFLIGGVWVLRASPNPTIDVWWLHQAATDALLSFRNPYVLSAPVLDTHTGLPTYDSYVYPPALLLILAPFRALLGDVRYAGLMACLIVWWATVKIAERVGAPPVVADAVGALVLLHPRSLFVVEQAWTEPINAALVFLGVWAYIQKRLRLAVLFFGLAIFSKQNLVVLAPILPFLPNFGWRRAMAAGGVAAVIVAPFFLWAPGAFWHGVVELHWQNVHRLADSNSFSAYMFHKGFVTPNWFSLVLGVGVAMAGAVWRRFNPAGLFATFAASLVCLFAFGRQAFANYYWLTAELFALAAVLALIPSPVSSSLREWMCNVLTRNFHLNRLPAAPTDDDVPPLQQCKA